jgi:hydrogenase/urease accessory protein HupE
MRAKRRGRYFARARHGRRARFAAIACFAAVAVAALAGPARAHDARPLSVNITEQSAGLYLARLRAPSTVDADNTPALTWPESCRVLHREMRDDAAVPNETTLLRCTGGLEGQRIAVRYPLYNPSLSTLFRLSERHGKVLMEVLTPDRLEWQVPREPGWREVAAGYLKLGIEHIWKGWDHLLFVCGLLVLARTRRRVLLAITGFTLAHSLTLSMSALGLVQLPVAPVEAAIALSILFLACEIARPTPGGLAARFPIVVSSAFGLLHGFGFAAALREVGLPARELAIGLLCFNVGVEIGQVAFIASVVGIGMIVHRMMTRGAPDLAPLQGRVNLAAGYALGVPAAFWLCQRIGEFF